MGVSISRIRSQLYFFIFQSLWPLRYILWCHRLVQTRRYLHWGTILYMVPWTPMLTIGKQSLTVCPSSSDPFYILSYYINWVTTSWTYSIFKKILFQISLKVFKFYFTLFSRSFCKETLSYFLSTCSPSA